MPFVKTNYHSKQEKANRERNRPTYSFRADREVQQALNRFKQSCEMSEFINTSIKRNIYLEQNIKRFILALFENCSESEQRRRFYILRGILRSIGNNLGS